MSALLTGTGFCILAILLTMILLRHLGITYTADRWEGKEPGWKPGIIFYVAGMLCLILAVTHEAL